MLLLSGMRDFSSLTLSLSASLPPLAVIFIICPSKLAFFSHSPLLIISVLTLHSLTNIPSSITPLCFCCLSFSHSYSPPPPPLFFQLSGCGYLRLRIHKTRLRCVCFCYFPKIGAQTATLLAADPCSATARQRRASCGLVAT